MRISVLKIKVKSINNLIKTYSQSVKAKKAPIPPSTTSMKHLTYPYLISLPPNSTSNILDSLWQNLDKKDHVFLLLSPAETEVRNFILEYVIREDMDFIDFDK